MHAGLDRLVACSSRENILMVSKWELLKNLNVFPLYSELSVDEYVIIFLYLCLFK
jgi:hypothetical protein